MRAKFINEDLSYMYPDFQKIIDLFEKYDLHFDLDGMWEVHGEEEMYGQGYEEYTDLVSYSFDLGNSYPINSGDSINLEIITDTDGEKFFQVYRDASPIMFGDERILDPDHQPLESLDEKFVKNLAEYLNDE